MAAALQRNMETPHLRHERIPVSVRGRSRFLLQSLYSSLLTPTRFSSSDCTNAAIPARHASINGFAVRKMQSGVFVPDDAASRVGALQSRVFAPMHLRAASLPIRIEGTV
jgi:hypothetical protein